MLKKKWGDTESHLYLYARGAVRKIFVVRLRNGTNKALNVIYYDCWRNISDPSNESNYYFPYFWKWIIIYNPNQEYQDTIFNLNILYFELFFSTVIGQYHLLYSGNIRKKLILLLSNSDENWFLFTQIISILFINCVCALWICEIEICIFANTYSNLYLMWILFYVTGEPEYLLQFSSFFVTA